MSRKITSFIISLVLIITSFFTAPSLTPTAEAQQVTFTGTGWSQSIGWMQVSGGSYAMAGEKVDDTRINLSGYAWTSTIGWISFNAQSVSGCDLSYQSGTTGCAPYIDTTGAGPFRVRGFARACAVFESGCSGPTKLTNPEGQIEVGGWDGYISLNSGAGAWGWELAADGSRITGYAWGDSVIGWLDINAECVGCDIGDPADTLTAACGPAPSYMPTFAWETLPLATSCALVSENGTRIAVPATHLGFIPQNSNFLPPEGASPLYRLECTRAGVNQRLADVRVGRCSGIDEFCPAPNDSIRRVDVGGVCPTDPNNLCPDGSPRPVSGICISCPSGNCDDYCPAPNQTILKANPQGTNCPASSFCPAPNGTVLKADAAGSNCTRITITCPTGVNCARRPTIIEI